MQSVFVTVAGDAGAFRSCKTADRRQDNPMPQRLSNVPMADLVPETRDWNSGSGIDLRSWITCVGKFEYAIGYGEVFWPDFVEHEGCVFCDGFSKESYSGFMKQTGGVRQAVEAVMNHLHVLDLFCGPDLHPTREQVLYLGRLLKEMWAAKLQRDFPDKRFVVSFPEDPLEGLLDYELTFFQVSD